MDRGWLGVGGWPGGQVAGEWVGDCVVGRASGGRAAENERCPNTSELSAFGAAVMNVSRFWTFSETELIRREQTLNELTPN